MDISGTSKNGFPTRSMVWGVEGFDILLWFVVNELYTWKSGLGKLNLTISVLQVQIKRGRLLRITVTTLTLWGGPACRSLEATRMETTNAMLSCLLLPLRWGPSPWAEGLPARVWQSVTQADPEAVLSLLISVILSPTWLSREAV